MSSMRLYGKSGLRHAAEEWMLPPGEMRLLVRAARRARLLGVSRAQRAVLATNARLQGAYAGRRCFVLGNGPSLALADIESLGGEITVVMNHFNRHPALRIWQPVIHCAAEPAAFYDSPDGLRFLETLLSGYTSTTHVFPIELKPVFDRTGIVPDERLIYFRRDGRTAAEFDHIDLTGAMPGPHDTSILAVSVAIAMGCNPIVLLGLDYNWLSHRSINRHFYDDNDVWWPSEDMNATPYLQVMRQSILSWEAHAALRRIASSGGQTIVNATDSSFLDAYPSTTLAEVWAAS